MRYLDALPSAPALARLRRGLALSAWLSLVTACGAAQHPESSAQPNEHAAQPSSAQALLERARQNFTPLPEVSAQDPARVALGRQLFFETRVSSDGQVGCVSCHMPEKWGTDGLPTSKGTFGRANPRNAPTVFNAFLQSSEHWHGDRESVEDQALRALQGPNSFGLASEAEATAKLVGLSSLAAAFQTAFPDEKDSVTPHNWAVAIGAYERTLLTPSAFDAFLGGKTDALSSEAQAGLRSFIDIGCAECHDGPLLGGRAFRKFGRFVDYATLTHSDPVDNGRFDVTHEEADRFVFKVAGLRNVEHSGPYFHDGSVRSLAEAVHIMAEAQLGVQLAPELVSALVSFLNSLSAPVPQAFSPLPL